LTSNLVATWQQKFAARRNTKLQSEISLNVLVAKKTKAGTRSAGACCVIN
jgi:hypothetical protein